MSEYCESCDKKCKDHNVNSLLTRQCVTRIKDLEGMVVENSNDNNNIEGRLNAFLYTIGITFALLVSISYIGLNKINAYKEESAKTTKAYTESLSKLTASVMVASERTMDIKESQASLTKVVHGIDIKQSLIKADLEKVKAELKDDSGGK